MNDDNNIFLKYYAPLLSWNIQEDVSKGTEYESVKHIFCLHKNVILGLLLNKSKSVECEVSLIFFVANNNKLSSHVDQISEHINYTNQKII